MKIKLSDFLTLNVQDLLKGLIVAVLGAATTTIYSLIQSGPIDWNNVWKVSLAAGLSYLIKNFFSPQPEVIVVDRSKTKVEYDDTKPPSREGRL